MSLYFTISEFVSHKIHPTAHAKGKALLPGELPEATVLFQNGWETQTNGFFNTSDALVVDD